MASNLKHDVDFALWFVVRGASIEMMRDLFDMTPATVRGSRKLLNIDTPKIDEDLNPEYKEYVILLWQAFETELQSHDDRIQAWMHLYKNVLEEQTNLATLYSLVKKAMIEDDDDDY